MLSFDNRRAALEGSRARDAGPWPLASQAGASGSVPRRRRGRRARVQGLRSHRRAALGRPPRLLRRALRRGRPDVRCLASSVVVPPIRVTLPQPNELPEHIARDVNGFASTRPALCLELFRASADCRSLRPSADQQPELARLGHERPVRRPRRAVLLEKPSRASRLLKRPSRSGPGPGAGTGNAR